LLITVEVSLPSCGAGQERFCFYPLCKGKDRKMTRHQYEILKKLRFCDRLKNLFIKPKGKDCIATKQAEIELAGQAAAKSRPPLDGEVDIIGKE
jgi:hypothetical protein